MQQFAALLAQTSTLQSLGLGDSSLGDSGIAELAPGLQQSSSLQTLDVEHKGITAQGAQTLSTALRESSGGLRCLRLSRNDLGDQGEAGHIDWGNSAGRRRHLET